MSRLIDVEALPTSIENMDLEVAEKIVERWMQNAPCDISWDAVRVLRDFYDEVKDAPTIDAVPVIRCKDCKYSVDYYNDGECYCRRPGREMQWISKKWDFFCKAGKRSDETD